jgi:hypothetical protein
VGKNGVTDEELRAAVKRVAVFKGHPWSESEFNAECYHMRFFLARMGATEDQLKLYDRLVAEIPVKGGRFNPYSGD